jgi:hypothetical protein
MSLTFANMYIKGEQISKVFATVQFSNSCLIAFSSKPETIMNIPLNRDKLGFTTVRNLACRPKKKKRNIAQNETF